jgi:hypothetical protein
MKADRFVLPTALNARESILVTTPFLMAEANKLVINAACREGG